MATYYKVVCHECKEQVDLTGYTKEYIVKVAGEWVLYNHIGHNISIFHDVCGWDDEYDKLYDSTEKYKEVTAID